METEIKTNLRKFFWHLLMAVCVAVYAAGLALACDAAGREEFKTFWTFAESDVGKMALKNTAVLANTIKIAALVTKPLS